VERMMRLAGWVGLGPCKDDPARIRTSNPLLRSLVIEWLLPHILESFCRRSPVLNECG